MSIDIADDEDRPSEREVRFLAVSLADQYAGDPQSLFALAQFIEYYIETGDAPDFDDNESNKALN